MCSVRAELKTLERYRDRLIKPTFSKTKVLMTCRVSIYRNEQVFKSDLFRKENVVSFHSAENARNEKDKYDLLAIYRIDKSPFTYDKQTLTSKMFPFLCNFFSKEKQIKSYGHRFFKSPVPCILKLLDKLETENRIHYAALVLLMANGNELSEETLDNDVLHGKKRDFLKKCKVPQHTDSFQILDALSEMQDTYTDRHGSFFIFIHSYLFEIIAYHFGRRFPELILQYMSSYYIACYIKIDTQNSKKRKRKNENEDDNVENKSTFDEEDNAFNLCIHLTEESQYQHFADRLVKDVEKGDFYVVFGNNAFEEQPVRFAFIETLKKKSFEYLRSIFLSDFNRAFNITDFIHEQSMGHLPDIKYICCLMTCYRCLQYSESYNARAVNWVIGYGHFFILDFIIDQIIKANGTVDDLFQTTLNERHLHSSVMMEQNDTFVEESADQNETDLEEDSSQDEDLMCESDVESENSVNVQMKESNTGYDKDSNSFVEINNDPVLQEQCRLICLGCYSGNLNIVLLLLKYVKKDALNISVSPRKRFFKQYNPYEIENELKNLNINTELLKERTIVNIKTGYETPLTVACEKGNLTIVQELLKNGASVNCTAGKDRQLTAACRYGYSNIVSELLKAKAFVNFDTGFGTPLTAACEQGNVDIVLELLKAGADVNFGFDNPLESACESGHLCIVRALIQEGAEIKLLYTILYQLHVKMDIWL